MKKLPLVLSVMLAAAPAQAVERQHHLGLGPQLSLLKTTNSAVAPGGGVGVFYTYGINDQFNFVLDINYSRLTYSTDPIDAEKDPNPPNNRPSGLGTAGAGIMYTLDVLRVVPSAGLMLDGHFIHGGTMPALIWAPGAALAVGVDYQFNRSISLGFAYRQHFILTQLATYPSYSTFALKVELSWGH